MNQETLQKFLSSVTQVIDSTAEWIKTIANIDTGDYGTSTALGIIFIVGSAVIYLLKHPKP